MATFKILVVDDSDPIRNTLRLTLEFKGYEVDEATNGEEGLQLIQQNSYDLIFCDLAMPGIDGIGLIQQVRGPLNMTQVPIIVLSAEEFASKKKALEAGANAFIDKPFSPQQVLTKLESILPA